MSHLELSLSVVGVLVVVIACPWHDLAFDIRNGQGIDGGGYCVGSYEVRLDGNDILIGPRRKI